MAIVVIDLNTMTATVKPAVVTKYARKLVQDELKAKGIYDSTVWSEGTEDGVMQFKITHPLLRYLDTLVVRYDKL